LTDLNFPKGSVVCIDAGSDHGRASAALADLGMTVVETFTRRELLSNPLRIRSAIADSGVGSAVIFSPDWSRQSLPQLLEASVVSLPVSCIRYDGATGEAIQISRFNSVKRLVALPLVLSIQIALAGWNAWRLCRPFSQGAATAWEDPEQNGAVLAMWLVREDIRVGGSVSHIKGIVSGFRARGLRVGLLTCNEPPEELRRLVDDVEVLWPVAEGARVMPYTEAIALNRQAAAGAARLVARLRPDFIYQRHAIYLTAGAELASSENIPLVLEVNGPAVWSRENWEMRAPGEGPFLRVALAMEKATVEGADLIASVSSNAEDALLKECGARPAKLLVSPNAVSPDQIDLAIAGMEPPAKGRVTLGWVGSFGPWHGAKNLVEALADLPESVDALMIGEGEGKAECQELADSLGAGERLKMPGSLPHAETLRQLAGCHILVSPHVGTGDQSFFGSPTKLFEFMAIGRPIVASDLEQIGEVLTDGVTAVLVEQGSVRALVEGIKLIMRSPDLGRALGAAARAEALAHHTWEKRAAEILEALRV